MLSPERDEASAQTLVDPLVSGVLHRWSEQGLPGDPWPFMAICSLGRLQHLLTKAVDAELKSLGLSRTGFFVLTTLALLPRRATRLSTLSRLVLVHPTTVKLTVDQLEAVGLVQRHPHPHDRRATLVEITEFGMDCAGRANQALADCQTGLLATLNHEDLFTALTPLRLAAGDVEL